MEGNAARMVCQCLFDGTNLPSRAWTSEVYFGCSSLDLDLRLFLELLYDLLVKPLTL